MFKNNKLIHGLNIGNYSIKIVSIHLLNKSIELKKASFIKNEKDIFSDGMINDPAAVKKSVEKLIGSNKKGFFSAAVANQFIVVRNMTLPYMKKEAINETIKWEFSEYIPFSIENAVIDYIIRKQSKKQLKITAVIVPERIVNSYLNIFKDINLQTLNIEAAALLSLFKFKKINDNILIVDIGYHSTKLIVGNSLNIFFIRNLRLGVSELGIKDGNSHKLSKVNEKQSSTYYKNYDKKKLFIKELEREIKRALRFYDKNNKDNSIKDIYLTGGGAYISNLKEIIDAENEFLNIRVINPFSEMKFEKGVVKKQYNASSNYTEYSVAAGLCLSEVLADEN